MVKPSWMLTVAAVLGLAFVLSIALGYAWLGGAMLTLSILIIAVANRMGKIKIMPITGAKTGNYVIIGAVVLAVLFGGISAVPVLGPVVDGFITPLSTASYTGAVTSPITSVSATECAARVSDEVRGQSATVNLEGYDMESNTPYASNKIGLVDYYYQIFDNSGNGGAIKSSAGGTSISSVSGGNVIKMWEKGSNQTSAYMDPIEVCVDQLQKTVEVNVHTPVAQSNMQITGYDKTGSAGLSAGTVAGSEDYDITLGADGEETFYLELANNVANKMFRLGALAVVANNDIDSCKPVDAVWQEVPVPDFLDIAIANDTTGTWNITGGYDKTYVLASPVELSEWEDVKYKFTIKAGSTDPATQNVKWSLDDNCIVCFLDVAYSRGESGTVTQGFFVPDDGEADVGVAEDYVYPIGKTTCVAIEGI